MNARALSLTGQNAVPEQLDTLSDEALVARAKAGDTEAFDVLVARHQGYVFNAALRIVRDAVLAEDMAQEAFLKAYRLLSGFRGDSAFSTWLYRVTVNVCLSEMGRRSRTREVAFEPAHERAAASCEEGAEVADTAAALRRCVMKLPERYRRIITLYYLKETAYEEIASLMRVPMGTLKTWMHRARNELKVIVEKDQGLHDAR